ncbi:MAG: prephenate dehydrogenase/arogenate dehydrogenase family protein [Trueperaceae bacterium]
MRPAALYDTLVIAGIGLIGGSVGLAARQRFLAKHVIGLDQDPVTLEAAIGLGAIDEAKLSPGEWLTKTDLVVLATPVTTLPTLAASLEPYLGKHTVVTDVGGVKTEVVQALSHMRFVGGHPMAGSEKAGVQHSSAALLENAVWVLTPNENTDPAAVALVREFVTHIGARPIKVSPEQHDRLVATISHVPYLAAVALTQLIEEDKDRDLMMLLAAGGYRDLTRIASGNPIMSRDMVLGNKDAIRETLRGLRQQLAALEGLLDKPQDLLEAAQNAKRTRDSFPIVKRSMLPARYEIVVAVPDKPGQLATITSALGHAEINIKDIEVLGIREAGGALRLALETDTQMKRAIQVLEKAGYEIMTKS